MLSKTDVVDPTSFQFEKKYQKLIIQEWRTYYFNYKTWNIKKNSPQENLEQYFIKEIERINDFYKKMEKKYKERQNILFDQVDELKLKHDFFKKNDIILAFQEHIRALNMIIDFKKLNHVIMKHSYRECSNLNNIKFDRITERSYFIHSNVIEFLIKSTEQKFVEDLFYGKQELGLEKLYNFRNDKDQETDVFSSGFQFGISVFATCLIIFLYLYDYPKLDDTSIFLFKLTLLPIMMLIAQAFNVLIWTKKNINWRYIFVLNSDNILQPYQFINFALLVYNVWVSFLIFYMALNIFETRNTLFIHGYTWIVPTVMIGLFFLWLFLPAFPGWFYSSQRFWFLTAIGRMLISPILKVEFRDFWIADQLTSLSDFFFETQFVFCMFPIQHSICKLIIELNLLNIADEQFCSSYITLGLPIVSLIPFHIRFWQCIRRLVETRQWFPHLINSIKYFLSMLSIVLVFVDLRVISFGKPYSSWNALTIVWMTVRSFSSLYSLCYDFYVDWGLFRNRLLLREEKLFSPVFYYVCMWMNACLRFAWIPFVIVHYILQTRSLFWMDLAVACLEIFRRFMWNNIRIENEFLNNIGEYRPVRDLPLPFEITELTEKKKTLKKVRNQVRNIFAKYESSLDDPSLTELIEISNDRNTIIDQMSSIMDQMDDTIEINLDETPVNEKK
eukprot:gene6152-10159_t